MIVTRLLERGVAFLVCLGETGRGHAGVVQQAVFRPQRGGAAIAIGGRPYALDPAAIGMA